MFSILCNGKQTRVSFMVERWEGEGYIVLQRNTYCYLQPMVMMEYVCVGEVRFTLRPRNY